MFRTLVAAGLVLLAGVWVLSGATHGFRAFTQETARRVSVDDNPRPVPGFALELQDGRHVALDDLDGRWVVLTFMFSSCRSICPVVMATMARLRADLNKTANGGDVQFVSISFDPDVDTTERLADYADTFGADPIDWWVARPRSGLANMLRFFGVTVIPAGNGMYVHNAAFYLIDKRQRLVAILDVDDPAAVRARLKQDRDRT